MVPAAEVAWLDAGLTADAALTAALATPHARYPVGRGSLDRFAGIIHMREIVAAARADGQSPIADRVAPAPIIPETKDLGALLRELREGRDHLAVVADEYGGTAGIVTLEDILEEIVGEIADEYDLPDDTLSWVGERSVLVAGSMTIDDFNEEVGTQLARDGARTMAGLVFAALGRRPQVGDAVDVGTERLTIEATDALRITRLRVELGGPDRGGAAEP
jgi:putative hemolysin